MKRGRPTKFTENHITRVDAYLKTTGREQTSLPTVEGLAVYYGVAKNTVYQWAKKHKNFKYALRKLLAIQAKQLIDDGIYGGKEVNPTIIKLMLQNNHGMKERRDYTSAGKPIMGGTANVSTNNSIQETSNAD